MYKKMKSCKYEGIKDCKECRIFSCTRQGKTAKELDEEEKLKEMKEDLGDINEKQKL